MQLSFPSEFKTTDDSGSFTGIAAVYSTIDHGQDVIEPGAIKQVDLTHDGMVRVLAGHDARAPIGKGRIREAADGLHIAGKINLAITAGRDTWESIKMGVTSGLSIGYTILENGFQIKGGVRHLTDIKLFEVSTVVWPMNADARITGFKSAMACNDVREFEDLVRRSLGLSARQAKRLASVGWASLVGGDEPETEAERIAERLDELTQLLRGGYERS